jgi:hypothetical protein
MSTLIIQDLPNVTNYLKHIDSVIANGIVGGSTQPVPPMHTACFSSMNNAQSYLALLQNDGGLLAYWTEGSCVHYACVSDGDRPSK